jgi:gliding motility-associated-like protein
MVHQFLSIFSNYPKFTRITGIILFILVIFAPNIQATHLRAGEITARRIGVFEYEFVVTLYTDNSSGADSPQLTLNFGDGTTGVVSRDAPGKINIGNATSVATYTIRHTYPSSGAFRVFFREENRNPNVVNMTNSILTPFSVETLVIIDPIIGLNNSPRLSVPPIDLACVGNRFTHNPGAFDVDGDSLSFKLDIPNQDNNVRVADYRVPNNTAFNGATEAGVSPGLFSINPVTGLLTWDSPGTAGEYNIAFLIEEWRGGIRIGFVKRDMQIIVNSCPNKRPNLIVPNICVVANEDPTDNSNIINEIITATDPDTPPQPLTITSDASQGVYRIDVFNQVASFTYNPSPQFTPASGTFRWTVGCEHVREEPYLVVFKAEDDPFEPNNTALVDIKTMIIQVKGPPPVLVQPLAQVGRAFRVVWEDYRNQCPSLTDAQIANMEFVIWRREGCLTNIACQQDPAMLGYEEIGRVPLSELSFLDESILALGVSYSYVVTVNFPGNKGGVSQASNEACVRLAVEAPVITNVTVNSTSTTAGEIAIRWIFPPELNRVQFPGPYSYNIYRVEGLNGTAFVRINPTPITDAAANPAVPLTYTDTGLNTETNPYRYFIQFFGDNTGVPTDSSDAASSVRLTATGAVNSIILEWNYNVPWSNRTDIPQGVGPHSVYRRTSNVNNFRLIAEVNVGQTRYVDLGQFNNECLNPDSTYIYYVTTKGSYFNPTVITVSPLLNDSQEDSDSPIDEEPPLPPILSIVENDCSFLDNKLCSEPLNFDGSNLENELFWKPQLQTEVCQDVAFYKLYYRGVGQADYDFNNPIYMEADTFFVHQNLPEIRPDLLSRAGCYVVVAVDQSGNESELSNEVCIDNCLYYELPNAISPNGDDKNDVFEPCPSPLYAESADVKIYNRWGGLVFERNGNLNIEWDGTDKSGNAVAAGVYYYEAKVKFFSIDPAKANQIFKGWVEVVNSKTK